CGTTSAGARSQVSMTIGAARGSRPCHRICWKPRRVGMDPERAMSHGLMLLSRGSERVVPYFRMFVNGALGRVAYLGAADNVSRLLTTRLSDIKEPIIRSRPPF